MPKKKEKLIFEDSDFKKLLDIYEGGNSIALTIIKYGLDYRLLEFTKSQAKEFIDLIISDGIIKSSPITNPNGIGYISVDIDCNMLSDIIAYSTKEEDIDDIVRYTVDTIITAVDRVDNIGTVEWSKLLRISWWKNSKRAKKVRDAFIKNIDKIYKNEKCKAAVEDFISEIPVNFRVDDKFKDIHTKNVIKHLKRNYPSFFDTILGDDNNDI